MEAGGWGSACAGANLEWCGVVGRPEKQYFTVSDKMTLEIFKDEDMTGKPKR